eukprot:GHVR01050569.1.p1 GENE.GHVR01050569.1~~GHVR01050569.1.p1  ORF type:complete len:162 (+),score=19.87 GHVR01050569.1:905-1390(+)
MAKGIQQFGNCGYVHRDIKPANFVQLENGVVQLLDFDCYMKVNTENKSVCGTLSYLPPEVNKNGETITKAADVYSLGVVIYRLYNKECFDNNILNVDFSTKVQKYQKFQEKLDELSVLGLNTKTQQNARDFILSMVREDPEKRPTIEAVIETLLSWYHEMF